eukprot:scaffold3077_cov162-Amphora_coffeaeformis.AAC.21
MELGTASSDISSSGACLLLASITRMVSQDPPPSRISCSKTNKSQCCTDTKQLGGWLVSFQVVVGQRTQDWIFETIQQPKWKEYQKEPHPEPIRPQPVISWNIGRVVGESYPLFAQKTDVDGIVAVIVVVVLLLRHTNETCPEKKSGGCDLMIDLDRRKEDRFDGVGWKWRDKDASGRSSSSLKKMLNM